LSASASAKIDAISSSVIASPRADIAVANSWAVICPSSFMSSSLNVRVSSSFVGMRIRLLDRDRAEA
jgi:hypothetical protein